MQALLKIGKAELKNLREHRVFCHVVGASCNHGSMTTGTVDVSVLTVEDIDVKRRELLARVGMSLYELRARAHEYELSIDELEILRALERLEFIAGS